MSLIPSSFSSLLIDRLAIGCEMSVEDERESGEILSDENDEEQSTPLASPLPTAASGEIGHAAWQWDDSVLVKAWDAAMRSYREQHGDRDWKTHDDLGQEDGAEPEAAPEADGAVRDRDQTTMCAHKRSRDAHEDEDHRTSVKRARYDTTQTPATTAPSTTMTWTPPLPRSVVTGGEMDVEEERARLAQLLHAWYWAGYAAACYDLARETPSKKCTSGV